MPRDLYPSTIRNKQFPFQHAVRDTGAGIEVHCSNQFYSATCLIRERKMTCSFTRADDMPALTFNPPVGNTKASFGFQASPKQMHSLITKGEQSPTHQAIIFLSGVEELLSMLFSQRIFYTEMGWTHYQP